MVRVSLLKVFEKSDDSRRLLASASDDASLFPDEGEYKPPTFFKEFGSPDPADDKRSNDFGISFNNSDPMEKQFKKSPLQSNPADDGFGSGEDAIMMAFGGKPSEKSIPKRSSRRASVQNGGRGSSFTAGADSNKKPERRMRRAESARTFSDGLSKSAHENPRATGSRRGPRSKKQSESKEDSPPKRMPPKRGLSRRSSTGNLKSLVEEEAPEVNTKEKERKRGMRRSSTGDFAPVRTPDSDAADKSKKISGSNHSKLGSSSHSKLSSSSHSKRLPSGKDPMRTSRRSSTGCQMNTSRSSRRRSLHNESSHESAHSASLTPPSDTEDEEPSGNNGRRSSKTTGKIRGERKNSPDEDNESFG